VLHVRRPRVAERRSRARAARSQGRGAPEEPQGIQVERRVRTSLREHSQCPSLAAQVAQPGADPAALGIVVAQVLVAALQGPLPAFMHELFPLQVRYSGVSLGYQLGSLIGGGFTPIIATALYAEFGSFVPVALLVLVAAVVTGVSIMILTENRAASDHSASSSASGARHVVA